MRVLAVTAHPDDECMFFTPSIVNFRKKGYEVDLLCLSTGNADGKGEVRVKELKASARILGIDRVFAVDDKDLQDGMNNKWPARRIKKHIEEVSANSDYKFILTFDDCGVSGHLNHCSISEALPTAGAKRYPPIKKLRTVSLFLKYSGILGTVLIRAFSKDYESISLWDAYKYGYRAMLEHKSQLVWFRRLYLVFSLYMTINILDDS